MALAPCPGGIAIGAQQLLIEFADCLDLVLESLIVAQPATHFWHLLTAQTDLTGACTRIAHGEDPERMAFAASAFSASRAMAADGPFQQGPTQELGGNRQAVEEVLAFHRDLVTSHSRE